jgi:hypothetical protein
VAPSGASDGEYRGLAVSQAEAVLEPPPPPPVAPQQHAGGLDPHPSLQPQVRAQPAARWPPVGASVHLHAPPVAFC